MKFSATLDEAEFGLIEAVGKLIDPTAWEDPRQYKRTADGWVMDDSGALVVDQKQTDVVTGINERNRARACERAVDIIECVRNYKPQTSK